MHAWLLAAVIAVALLPLVGSFAAGEGISPMFGVFPPYKSDAVKPGVNWLVFGALALFGIAALLFVLVPQWFGFKQRGTRRRLVGGVFPAWFFGGIAVMLGSWYLRRHKISVPTNAEADALQKEIIREASVWQKRCRKRTVA